MPIISTGPQCARRGCRYPPWKDALCSRCWRLGHMFGKDPAMFAYEPLDGYRDDDDAVEFPWQRWQQAAETRGQGLADLFAEPPPDAAGPEPPSS